MKLLLDCATVAAAVMLYAVADILNDPLRVLDNLERSVAR